MSIWIVIVELHVNDSRQLETYYICERMKQIALKHNIAIVVLSQLSKTVETREDHRSVTSDFAYRDTPNYFDNVSFIYRDEYYNRETEYKGIAEIIPDRNKHFIESIFSITRLEY